MLQRKLFLSQEPTSKMADYEQLAEGQKVVFRHKIGDAGNLAKTEKVGHIEKLDDPDRDFPVKVRIGVSSNAGSARQEATQSVRDDAQEVLDEDDPVKTYLEPEEINNIIK